MKETIVSLERRLKMNNVKLVELLMRLELVETDLASPNFVADFAANRDIQLTSSEIVEISNAYEREVSNV
jgi:hypothetical protein